MTEDRIARLFAEKGLGALLHPIRPVSGGCLHRMYRVEAESGVYAVKQLNPGVMARPEALGNYRRADALEKVLEDAGIPIVPALALGGSKLQVLDGAYFYVYPWQNGQITDPHAISPAQCRTAGSIQGRIHAIAPARVPKPAPVFSRIDWRGLMEAAAARDPGLAQLLRENEALLLHAESELNTARAALPGLECIVDEDMDPKNVMWDEGCPKVIDLECLERGNPVSSALQLSLQWAGVTVCELDLDRLRAFFDGYLAAYDNGFRAYSAVFGLAYTWVEWLAYNVERAAGQCADEAERETGAAEARLTVGRIRYLSRMEDEIKRHLDLWFGEMV